MGAGESEVQDGLQSIGQVLTPPPQGGLQRIGQALPTQAEGKIQKIGQALPTRAEGKIQKVGQVLSPPSPPPPSPPRQQELEEDEGLKEVRKIEQAVEFVMPGEILGDLGKLCKRLEKVKEEKKEGYQINNSYEISGFNLKMK